MKMYNGINDIPTFNWWELNEKLDLDQLLVEPLKKKATSKQIYKLQIQHKIIKDEFFDKIVLNMEVEAFILKKAKLSFYECKILLDEDPNFFMTKYLILKSKIDKEELEMTNSGVSNLEIKAAIQESQGFYIDTRVVPIADFHAMADRYKAKMEAQQKAANRRKVIS